MYLLPKKLPTVKFTKPENIINPCQIFAAISTADYHLVQELTPVHPGYKLRVDTVLKMLIITG